MTSQDRDAKVIAEEIASKTDCDIIFYNGNIERPCDEALIRECMRRGKKGRRPNVMLVLVTYGGDPDAAYRMARCLQRAYQRFSVYVPGLCKSAGTLLALGAHELIISDHGELGPLDIQMVKKDEFFDRQSGLTVMAALQALDDRAYIAAEQMLMKIEASTGGLLSIQTATRLAADLVIGMYSEIASQIDPIHVGEASRQMLIAQQYGTRLTRLSRNLKGPGALTRLTSTFPSHGFVIDREEAIDLFVTVREPNASELEMVEAVGMYGRRVKPQRAPGINPADVLQFWTKPVTGSANGGAHADATTRGGRNAGRTPARSGSRPAAAHARAGSNGRTPRATP